jgi:predicted dithiol-disulfide oxidoreductase (DUF899 family)
MRDRRAHLLARSAGHERVRAQDGVVYHTYSAYACGLDGFWGMYQWLDRAPTSPLTKPRFSRVALVQG